jgi:hypothetical protein
MGVVYLTENETGTRIYLQSERMMLNAINDLAELQRAEVIYADIPSGKLYFRVAAHGVAWDYRFTVEGMDGNRSRVTLDIAGEAVSRAGRIYRQLTLLDSMLPGTRDAEGE